MQRYTAALTGLLLTGAAAFAHADEAATRKALEKQYAKISQAYKTKNMKSIQDVTTPDYTLSMPSGQVVTRQAVEAQAGTYVSFVQKVTTATETLSKVAVKGDTATVNAQEVVSGVVVDPQTQKTHTMGLSNLYKDTWVKTGNNWLRKHSDLLKSSVITDGKTMDLGAALGKAQSKMQNAPLPKN